MMAAPSGAEMRRHVLRLYKQCLQSAAKCPESSHRATMHAYVQLKFRDKQHLRDKKVISHLLSDATDEVERMEYYHSLYRSKQAATVNNNTLINSGSSSSSSDSSIAQIMATRCPSCDYTFESERARYCSHCGVLRPPK